MSDGLSVVIAARDAAETIAQQIDSLISQPWPNGGEIIVADNGSQDETAAIVRGYDDASVSVIVLACADKPGAGYARNCGVVAAQHDKIAFCDADDVVDHRWVAAMTASLDTTRAVGGSLEFDRLNPGWVAGSRGRNVAGERLPLFDDTFPVLSSCNLGIDRSTFLDLGGFDTSYLRGQDAELSLRIQRANIEASFDRNAIVHYRMRQSVRDVYLQARGWGEAQVRLRALLHENPGGFDDRHHRMSRRRSWLWLGARSYLLATRRGRARWAYVAGTRMGVRFGMRHQARPSAVDSSGQVTHA